MALLLNLPQNIFEFIPFLHMWISLKCKMIDLSFQINIIVFGQLLVILNELIIWYLTQTFQLVIVQFQLIWVCFNIRFISLLILPYFFVPLRFAVNVQIFCYCKQSKCILWLSQLHICVNHRLYCPLGVGLKLLLFVVQLLGKWRGFTCTFSQKRTCQIESTFFSIHKFCKVKECLSH